MAHHRLSSWLRFRGEGRFAVWRLPVERPLLAGQLADSARGGDGWLHVASYEQRGAFSTYAGIRQGPLNGQLASSGARYLVLTGGYGGTSAMFADVLDPASFHEAYRVRDGRQTLVILEVNTPRDAAAPPVTMSSGVLKRLAA